ncbi:hypothetical protein [Candidatus Uabimicrobium amorphum]|uniref:Uncharacterized protein n=1 Tax=Uabimicrobium amorphum TaxID=2596890 RepID=A0A5S9IP34_UABAM|nr:hypothetical protein [Candidatus Uabimicrobium amorphum]BBM84590.1 hypothetical protein UABAM_02951 [Candidatus Uabimicrobium amorphum]
MNKSLILFVLIAFSTLYSEHSLFFSADNGIDQSRIVQFDLNSKTSNILVEKPVIGLDFSIDPANRRVYWIEKDPANPIEVIKRKDFTKNNEEVIYALPAGAELIHIDEVVVDGFNNQLFFSICNILDKEASLVQLDLATKKSNILVKKSGLDLDLDLDFAIDTINKRAYWIENKSEESVIKRKDFDGSNEEVVYSKSTGGEIISMDEVKVDGKNNQLFFSMNFDVNDARVMQLDMKAKSVKIIVQKQMDDMDFAIDFTNKKVLWIERDLANELSVVKRSNFDKSEEEIVYASTNKQSFFIDEIVTVNYDPKMVFDAGVLGKDQEYSLHMNFPQPQQSVNVKIEWEGNAVLGLPVSMKAQFQDNQLQFTRDNVETLMVNFRHLSFSKETARNIRITISGFQNVPKSILFQPLFGDPDNSPAKLTQRIAIDTNRIVEATYNFPAKSNVEVQASATKGLWILELHDTSVKPLPTKGYVDILISK